MHATFCHVSKSFLGFRFSDDQREIVVLALLVKFIVTNVSFVRNVILINTTLLEFFFWIKVNFPS